MSDKNSFERIIGIAQVKKELIGDSCFVVMSFSGNPILETYYKEGVEVVVRQTGLRPVRVDQEQFTGKISDKIRSGIDSARLVLVDLTEDKPNCYFEAGYAVARGKPVVFQRLDAPKYEPKFEFDVSDYPHVLYTTLEDLRRRLGERLKSVLANPRVL